jgi:hypothetical protein
MGDYFESSKLSLTLAWIFCIPLFFGFASIIITAFKKHEGCPWLYSAWIGICFLILSPIRYVAFLVTLAASYPFQNGVAFITVFLFWLWIPALLAFAVLNAVGLIGPIYLTLWVAGDQAKFKRSRLVASAVVAPLAAFLGTFVFSLILPFAAISTHDLNADAIIKATNGPAQIVFRAQSRGMIALPPYYAKTTQTNTDRVRTHVALLYLSDSDHDNFLKMEYPDLYAEYHNIVMRL